MDFNSNEPDGNKKRKSTANGDDDQKAKRRAQIAKAARKHRQRQKDELSFLRAKVADLEEEVDVLQQSEPSQQVSETGWQQEARQQAEMRARVDRENEFLRHTLVEQLKFTQRLQSLLAKGPLGPNPSEVGSLITSADTGAVLPVPQIGSSAPPPPSVGHRQMLIQTAADATALVPSAIAMANEAFSKATENLTYMGVEVQYKIDSNSHLRIFLRQRVLDVSHQKLASVIWEAANDAVFNQNFSFIKEFEILDTIDANTTYKRQVCILDKSGAIKTESIGVFRRHPLNDRSTSFGYMTVLDPSIPIQADVIRENTSHSIVVKELENSGGMGCELICCIHNKIDGNTMLTSGTLPTMLSEVVFEITPLWFSAMMNRARDQ